MREEGGGEVAAAGRRCHAAERGAEGSAGRRAEEGGGKRGKCGPLSKSWADCDVTMVLGTNEKLSGKGGAMTSRSPGPIQG